MFSTHSPLVASSLHAANIFVMENGTIEQYEERIYGLDSEQALLSSATSALERIPGLTIVGQAAHKAGVISFTLDGVHPHDLGTILDAEGVAVRAGHHCAMPVMDFFGVAATARASFGCYTDEADLAQLVRALGHAREVFG